MAYKAYERAAGESDNQEEKAMLLDSMLIVYNLKEAQFGLTPLEKNNLALRYYKYFRKDPNRLAEGLQRYREVYQSPETVVNNNLASYMGLIRLYDQKVAPLSLFEIADAQEAIQQVIALRLKEGADATKMQRYSATTDKIFSEMVVGRLTCDFVSKVATDMGTDLQNAKRVMAWSLEAGCTKETYFTDALEVIAGIEPNAGITKILAQKAAAAERYAEAIDWYTQSLTLEEDDMKRAGIQMDMARVYALNGEKAPARSAAFKAIVLDAAQSAAANSFVANLYMSSFDDCAEQYNQVEDRAVFMAAYDLFKKAGDVAGMQAAQDQFPTRSEAHTANRVDGESIDVGCWINVKTTVKTRASQ